MSDSKLSTSTKACKTLTFIIVCDNFLKGVEHLTQKSYERVLRFFDWGGAKEFRFDKSRQELSNEYLALIQARKSPAEFGSQFGSHWSEPAAAWTSKNPVKRARF